MGLPPSVPCSWHLLLYMHHLLPAVSRRPVQQAGLTRWLLPCCVRNALLGHTASRLQLSARATALLRRSCLREPLMACGCRGLPRHLAALQPVLAALPAQQRRSGARGTALDASVLAQPVWGGGSVGRGAAGEGARWRASAWRTLRALPRASAVGAGVETRRHALKAMRAPTPLTWAPAESECS